MHYTTTVAAALSAFFTLAVADPILLNSQVNPSEGVPFKFLFSGCNPCKVELVNGDAGDLKLVQVMTTEASGGSFTYTFTDLPDGEYAIRLTDADGNVNYSAQFGLTEVDTPAESSAAPTKSAASSAPPTSSGKATATATGSETTAKTGTESVTATKSASSKSTATESVSASSGSSTGTASTGSQTTTLASVTKSASSSATTTSAGTTTAAPTQTTATTTAFSRTSTSSTAKAAITTTPPGSGAGQISSPMGLVAGAVVAMAALL